MKSFTSYLIFSFVCFAAYLLRHIDEVRVGPLDFISYVMASVPIKKPTSEKLLTAIEQARNFRLCSEKVIDPLTLFFMPSLKSIPFVDVHIPVDAGKNSILLRLYNHETDSSMTLEKKKVLIYFHGGGWIIGSTKDNHAFTRGLAKETGYLVVSVDYRLAPEHVFPTAINDAYAALEWVLEHIGEYGGDREQVIIAGESAGGNLAAAVTSRFLANQNFLDCNFSSCSIVAHAGPSHGIVGLWLMYPPLNTTSQTPEAEEYDKLSNVLTIDRIELMRSLYRGNSSRLESFPNYWFSPLQTPDYILARYPPTLLTLAKNDVLTPEGLEFSIKLHNTGRSVRVEMYNSTVHGFVTAHPILGPAAVKESVQYMRQFFNNVRVPLHTMAPVITI